MLFATLNEDGCDALAEQGDASTTIDGNDRGDGLVKLALKGEESLEGGAYCPRAGGASVADAIKARTSRGSARVYTSTAIDAGASVATHLYNGMRPVHHREPGIVAAALEREEVACELVADGHHLHPAMLRFVFAVSGERVTLATDATSAAGAKDGRYGIGPAWVDAKDGEAYLEGTRTIADSTITMAGTVHHASLEARIPLSLIARAAASTPARHLNVVDEVGTMYDWGRQEI